MSKHALKYSSIDDAIKDGFKEIGGKGEALRVLSAGWYTIQERKLQNDRNKRLRDMVKEDPRFKSAYEQARERVKKQA